jgi:hypothetical protein
MKLKADRSTLWTLFVAGTSSALTAWAAQAHPPSASSHPAGAAKSAPATLKQPAKEQKVRPIIRWLAIGGGPVPEYNEASIEQDIALGARVLGPEGHVLFAGGASAVDVRELDPKGPADSLLLRLGAIFAPRAGRDSRYRRTILAPAGPATRAATEAELSRALRRGDGPLVLYLAGHGELGPDPADNTFALWGGGSLTAKDMAELLDRSDTTREVQLVVTSCFGGGLANVVFAAADPGRGAPASLRCGFFATSSDLPASGCDPNPDRAQQESYALHYWHALLGEDERGRKQRLAELDLDKNGTISPLEAHVRASIADADVDVPITASERWLRAKAPARGPTAAFDFPELEALVRGLAKRTRLPGDLRRVSAELKALESKAKSAQEHTDDLRADEDDAFGALSGELLARWPILDDPWNPGFAPLLAKEGKAIADSLDASAEYAAYQRAIAATDDADDQYWALRRRIAPVARLARALETRELAGRLKAQGGKDWATYERLLACERWRP